MAKTGSTFFQLYFSTFTLTGSIMKCPKCNYTSFDYLTECRKCGQLLDEVRKRLNLQVSKPVMNIDEDVTPEVESQMVEDGGLEMQETETENSQESMPAGGDGYQEEEELDAVSSAMNDAVPPLEGLGSMETLRDDESSPDFPDELPPAEESQEIAAAFNPSDEQLENLSIQEESAVEDEELPELDAEISDDGDSSTLEDEGYDHEKVIELPEEDQIFDLELDLEDDKETTTG